jgi:hypothetical protein
MLSTNSYELNAQVNMYYNYLTKSKYQGYFVEYTRACLAQEKR